MYLMNSLQVKSGSELVFPMLFDHMSFSTHRTWEMNMKVPYAKALSSWETHFKQSLKALRQKNSAFALQLGFLLPETTNDPDQQLPPGWLRIRSKEMPSENMKSVAQIVQGETGESMEYVFVSPKGCRFTSLKEALKHAQKQTSMDQLPQGAHTIFNAPNSTSVEFTSNHEDYMHRDLAGLFSQLPAFIYNMWIFKTKNCRNRQHIRTIPRRSVP